MNTYQIGIRPRLADCSHVDVTYIKGLTEDDAFEKANAIVRPKGYIVKDILKPGDFLPDEYCGCGRTIPKELYPLDNV
jgi:hypothetical protein